MAHTCHWPGCNREVPPELWGCKPHWYALPKFLRDAIWLWYVPGQEVKKNPSKQYVEVARIVQVWIEAMEPAPLIAGKPMTLEQRGRVIDEFKTALALVGQEKQANEIQSRVEFNAARVKAGLEPEE